MTKLNALDSYFLGLFLTDGSFGESTRNRGRIQIELSEKDKDILYLLHSKLAVKTIISHRVRNTNFMSKYHTYTLSIYDLEYRNWLKSIGILPGKKVNREFELKVDVEEVDFVRGLIDGDGSLGMTSNNHPFLGFVSQNEQLYNFVLNFCYKNVNKLKRVIKKNKRDDVYNIVFAREDAVKFSGLLYYKGCVSMKRKMKQAELIKKWKRDPNNRKRTWTANRWTKEEDKAILQMSTVKAAKKLRRTVKSITIRKFRLKNGFKY